MIHAFWNRSQRPGGAQTSSRRIPGRSRPTFDSLESKVLLSVSPPDLLDVTFARDSQDHPAIVYDPARGLKDSRGRGEYFQADVLIKDIQGRVRNNVELVKVDLYWATGPNDGDILGLAATSTSQISHQKVSAGSQIRFDFARLDSPEPTQARYLIGKVSVVHDSTTEPQPDDNRAIVPLQQESLLDRFSQAFYEAATSGLDDLADGIGHIATSTLELANDGLEALNSIPEMLLGNPKGDRYAPSLLITYSVDSGMGYSIDTGVLVVFDVLNNVGYRYGYVSETLGYSNSVSPVSVTLQPGIVHFSNPNDLTGLGIGASTSASFAMGYSASFATNPAGASGAYQILSFGPSLGAGLGVGLSSSHTFENPTTFSLVTLHDIDIEPPGVGFSHGSSPALTPADDPFPAQPDPFPDVPGHDLELGPVAPPTSSPPADSLDVFGFDQPGPYLPPGQRFRTVSTRGALRFVGRG